MCTMHCTAGHTTCKCNTALKRISAPYISHRTPASFSKRQIAPDNRIFRGPLRRQAAEKINKLHLLLHYWWRTVLAQTPTIGAGPTEARTHTLERSSLTDAHCHKAGWLVGLVTPRVIVQATRTGIKTTTASVYLKVVPRTQWLKNYIWTLSQRRKSNYDTHWCDAENHMCNWRTCIYNLGRYICVNPVNVSIGYMPLAGLLHTRERNSVSLCLSLEDIIQVLKQHKHCNSMMLLRADECYKCVNALQQAVSSCIWVQCDQRCINAITLSVWGIIK